MEHTTGTEAAGGHAETFPPFNTAHFGGELIWLAIAFGALYILMDRLALPRVSSIISLRRQKIDADLVEAQRLRDESAAAHEAYEAALAEARANAHAIASETRARVTAEADERRKALDAELAQRLNVAESQIAETKRSAMANVNSIAAEATEAIVARLLGTAPARDEVERAVAVAAKS